MSYDNLKIEVDDLKHELFIMTTKLNEITQNQIMHMNTNMNVNGHANVVGVVVNEMGIIDADVIDVHDNRATNCGKLSLILFILIGLWLIIILTWIG